MMVSKEFLKKERKESRRIVTKGKRWVKELKKELEEFPDGTWVAIDTETGEFVTGDTKLSVMTELGRKVPSCIEGYLHCVGFETHV